MVESNCRLEFEHAGAVCLADLVAGMVWNARGAVLNQSADTGHVIGCTSCDIRAGRLAVPGGTIYQDEYWHVDSVAPPVFWRGFLIVKLKRHCEHLAQLTPSEAVALGPVLQMTCQALSDWLNPENVYVCSFGDGEQHLHFWVLPRPRGMRPGMHSVMAHLDLRSFLTRRLGVRRWLCSEEQVAEMAEQLRTRFGPGSQGD